MSNSLIAAHLEALRAAPTAPDAETAAENLAKQVKQEGLQTLVVEKVLEQLHAFAANKKSGYERESAAVGLHSLATHLKAAAGPLLLASVPVLLELYSDKGDVVRLAATAAVRAILALFPPEATRVVLRELLGVVSGEVGGKWKTKAGALDSIRRWVEEKSKKAERAEYIAAELAIILPTVENAMHDTKSEVSNAAKKCATALCGTVPNPDLEKHIPALVQAMESPANVPATIKAMSNTTFVAEVTAPSLAVLVPLLSRALNDRSPETLRRASIVTTNIVKLVRDPAVAAQYLGPLSDAVHRVASGASFPEVRAFAKEAEAVLKAAGGDVEFNGTKEAKSSDGLEDDVLVTIIAKMPKGYLRRPKFELPGQKVQLHPAQRKCLSLAAEIGAELVRAGRIRAYDAEQAVWGRCVGAYIAGWVTADNHVNGVESNAKTEAKGEGWEIAQAVRTHYWDLERAKNNQPVNDDTEELLCDTLFSLAYGALLLLSHTTLRLVKGRRYGICAGNGSGKSTLLRALRDGKVENFPPQSEVRAVMVEHALQGEDASLSILDFIASDPQLANVSREAIAAQLREVGFDDERQAHTVGSLSGGWKMKLELARAMLYKADLLMLDEPTNHLDRASVKWLEDYLIAHDKVTVLTVSHDSGFLDNITTDIIHYESKKLVYYPGNLSKFVEKVPEAKSYYTLAATSVKFSFPPPGSLMGVRSNTRAILKLANCTFTYPGRKEPSLYNVSCALSLSSRVGIIGPNGAGKSTLIKLLTGETSPQEGTVYKHPALRVGYVSQHATHHIERHLEKTAVQYIQWRFQDGHDRELLEKSTRVLTEEEKELLEKDFVGRNGEKRKLELIMGRQKLKKSFQYEIKWRNLDHKFNTWIPREELLEKGFTKLVQQFDDLEASREGAGTRDTSANLVRKHLEDVGLDGDIAQYNEMSGLSGGQKVKVVIASSLWNNPQIMILDEPTNFLDREALGGLAVAIRDWGGAVAIISHNEEFVGALCPEIWNVAAGRMTHQGKTAVVEDAFADGKFKATPKGSPAASARASKAPTPAASASATPAGSGNEGGAPSVPKGKKKKLTRNQIKAQEERRRIRKLNWLTFGGPKPEDTDSD
ncbi:mRNA export factor elf1 OS=Schizosaccharomyces pombe (strain 972 / ATCC 24843) GN=elf1 PE=1 SV=1 [Rhizoctonia solani AG-1 IB]|uniref:mRNA export factor elf1 n=1 Tax=Thanatephorus cucumeris (strain AG1-IB / isolate 7/3/14) TaxID=1108050 RepID=A0A0B7F990_THACB|nr:mRNA export factor elf1 OS=Schizosaccharomyces pombe (strain 972 / ATCC 24843) GN=elf1 PE=1 SV=1 [Rhizoctonia solani AG-1 IB]